MPFTTPEQFIVLVLLLIGGWLIGYASAPSPKKWKRRVAQQSTSFTQRYTDLQARLQATDRHADDANAEADTLRAERGALEHALADARARHTRAERTIAELRAATAVTPSAAAPVPAEIADTAPNTAPELEPQPERAADDDQPHFKPIERTPTIPVSAPPAPATIGLPERVLPASGRFANTVPDDLTRLRGIDDLLRTRLFGLGVTSFADLETLSAQDEMALEQRLAVPAGYIAREQWRQQAALLRAGQDDAHAAQFGATEHTPTE